MHCSAGEPTTMLISMKPKDQGKVMHVSKFAKDRGGKALSCRQVLHDSNSTNNLGSKPEVTGKMNAHAQASLTLTLGSEMLLVTSGWSLLFSRDRLGKSPVLFSGPISQTMPMKKPSEKRKENRIVTQISTAILMKKVKKQKNITAPEPAVVRAPKRT